MPPLRYHMAKCMNASTIAHRPGRHGEHHAGSPRSLRSPLQRARFPCPRLPPLGLRSCDHGNSGVKPSRALPPPKHVPESRADSRTVGGGESPRPSIIGLTTRGSPRRRQCSWSIRNIRRARTAQPQPYVNLSGARITWHRPFFRSFFCHLEVELVDAVVGSISRARAYPLGDLAAFRFGALIAPDDDGRGTAVPAAAPDHASTRSTPIPLIFPLQSCRASAFRKSHCDSTPPISGFAQPNPREAMQREMRRRR